MNNLISSLKDAASKAVEHTKHEFSSINTGKAQPNLIENVMVDVYGSSCRLKDIAAILTPDSRTIQIQPWDKGAINSVSKAILQAGLGLNPIVSGTIIRVPIPELSGERRRDLVKVCNTMAEDGKVRVRGVRRDGMDLAKKMQKAGQITEDDLKKLEKDIQKITDDNIALIVASLAEKENELTKV